jgi:hypothetical protein
MANKSFTPVSGRDEKSMNKGYQHYGRVLAFRPGRQCSLAGFKQRYHWAAQPNRMNPNQNGK